LERNTLYLWVYMCIIHRESLDMVRRCGFWIGGRFCEDIYTFEAANRVYQERFFPRLYVNGF